MTSITDKKQAPKNQELDKDEIVKMLKRGAYHVLGDDEEQAKASRKFCEADIVEILQNSRHIHYQDAAVSTDSVFSQTATFISDKSDEEMKLDDPDFWKRMNVTPSLATDCLASNGKRERKKRSMFDFRDYDKDTKKGGTRGKCQTCLSF